MEEDVVSLLSEAGKGNCLPIRPACPGDPSMSTTVKRKEKWGKKTDLRQEHSD